MSNREPSRARKTARLTDPEAAALEGRLRGRAEEHVARDAGITLVQLDSARFGGPCTPVTAERIRAMLGAP